MEHKKYELETLEDIANCVTISNIDNLLEGFYLGIRTYITTVSKLREALRERGKDEAKMKNTDILGFKKMIYTDDSKQDINIGFTFEDEK